MKHPRGTALSARPAIPLLTARWLGLALISIASAIPAYSASLPAPSTNVLCSVEGNTFTNLVHCEFGGVPAIPSSAGADIDLLTPHAFATAFTPTTGVLGAGASATILYRFQVAGPTVGELVPILMDASLTTHATDESLAIARLIVSSTSGVFLGFEACTDGNCDGPSFSETISLSVLSGSTQDSVTLYAEAQARRNLFGNETATAAADPYIYVDPSFPDVHLYSVVVSPGIGNAPPPPVPEPRVMYLLGAGLLVLAARVSKR